MATDDAKVVSLQSEVRQLRNALAQKETAMTDLQNRLANMEHRTHDLLQKESLIAVLQHRTTDMENKVVKVDDLVTENRVLQDKWDNAQGHVEMFKNSLRKKDAVIKNLYAQQSGMQSAMQHFVMLYQSHDPTILSKVDIDPYINVPAIP